jgi:hypothetical protein
MEADGLQIVGPVGQDSPRRSSPPRFWLVVAAAGVLLLFGGVALLFPSMPRLGVPAPTTLPIEWSSSLTWSRVPQDETVFGGEGEQRMRCVTAGGPGLVAVGWNGDRFADVPDFDALVWTSVDDITWSRVPHDEEVFGAALMESVTAGPRASESVGNARVDVS